MSFVVNSSSPLASRLPSWFPSRLSFDFDFPSDLLLALQLNPLLRLFSLEGFQINFQVNFLSFQFKERTSIPYALFRVDYYVLNLRVHFIIHFQINLITITPIDSTDHPVEPSKTVTASVINLIISQ